MKQKAIEACKQGKYFETNKDAKAFLCTKDGMVFGEGERQSASVHAADIGSELYVVKRSDVEGETEPETEVKSVPSVEDVLAMTLEQQIEMLDELLAADEELTEDELSFLDALSELIKRQTPEDTKEVTPVVTTPVEPKEVVPLVKTPEETKEVTPVVTTPVEPKEVTRTPVEKPKQTKKAK